MGLNPLIVKMVIPSQRMVREPEVRGFANGCGPRINTLLYRKQVVDPQLHQR
jgi:hypothetical protein